MSENMVHNLYKFIKEGVTPEQMFAATAEAFCEKVVTDEAMLRENAEMESNQTFMLNHLNEVAPEGWEGTVKGMKKHKKISNPWALAHYMKGKGYKPHASEGKLPADLANIQKPDQYIQDLKEDEKKENIDDAANPAIKTDNAGVTPAPELTKVSQEMDKATPTVDKLTQDKNGIAPEVDAKAPAAKEEKKIEPKVTDVKKENEGKLPAAIANIQKPGEYIQNLAEEAERVIADGISEENVAKDLASRHKGEAVQNPSTKLWKVVSVVNPSIATAMPATSAATTVPAVEKKVNTCSKCSKEKCECLKEEKTTEPATAAPAGVPEVKDKEDVNVPLKTMATDKSNALASDAQVMDPGTTKTTKQEQPMAQAPAPSGQVIDPGTTSTVKQAQAANAGADNKTTEPKGTTVSSKVPEVSATTSAVPDVKSAKPDALVKEDVDVTIRSDGKEVNVVSAGGATTITTQDTAAVPISTETPLLGAETPAEEEEEEELELEEEPELSDEEALEMAERLMVAEHLGKLDEKNMSAKQKKFVEDMKAKKFSKKNTAKIEKKKKEIK